MASPDFIYVVELNYFILQEYQALSVQISFCLNEYCISYYIYNFIVLYFFLRMYEAAKVENISISLCKLCLYFQLKHSLLMFPDIIHLYVT